MKVLIFWHNSKRSKTWFSS